MKWYTYDMEKHSQKTALAPEQINPLTVILTGLGNLFSMAQPVALLLLAIAIVSFIFGVFNPSPTASDPTGRQTEAAVANVITNPSLLFAALMIIIIVCTFSLVVGTMLHGIQSYTALHLSKGRQVGLREAFNATLNQFGHYLILFVWMNIKIALWTLLFIVPGIIAFYRYSFAGIVFFDKKLKGEEAIKESSRLAKGGLLTIFASQFLFNLLTFFYGDRLMTTASLSVLYQKYVAFDKEKTAKPSAHPLSWVIFALPFVLFLMALAWIVSVFVIIGLAGPLGP